MDITLKQISSLHKIREFGINNLLDFKKRTAMKGEFFSYQISLESHETFEFSVETESYLKDHIKLYAVKNAIMDFPTYSFADDEYITKAPGTMPDILIPLELENNTLKVANDVSCLWISVDIPKEIECGSYPIKISFKLAERFAKPAGIDVCLSSTLNVEVIDRVIPEQSTMFAQWFHVDCIADIHNVEIYSEKHWQLIDKYMSLAKEVGFTHILTPVITPPLDTEVGSRRPCTQLVKIQFADGKYTFNFDLLDRWVDLCQKNKIKYFEISHLFSQWGLLYSPNIKVYENGEEHYKFGWHVEARSQEYKEFLTQFLPALIDYFKAKGLKDRCWFHISDEPHLSHLEAYQYAYNLVKPLIEGCVTFDALSDFAFYEQGLVDHPVTATNFLEPFLKSDIPHQWAYTCCGQYSKVGNRFLAMESYKNRFLGLQMYKYNIEGFLQWGYNFYYNQLSRMLINPYVTTSSDKAFPSGDAFSVYPIKDGVTPSIRALVFKEALNDIEVCKTLESLIGRDKVIELIDSRAGTNVTFKEYPRDKYFITSIIEEMESIIKKTI